MKDYKKVFRVSEDEINKILERCPLCNNEAKFRMHVSDACGRPCYDIYIYIECTNRGCGLSVQDYYVKDGEKHTMNLINKWNMRPRESILKYQLDTALEGIEIIKAMLAVAENKEHKYEQA